jgi:pimeloyl-ACP methyl ester carboxylesterase
MHANPFRRTALTVLAVGLILSVCADTAGAGGIIFKDGFVLKGRVRREGDTVFDPVSGQQVPVGKGFFILDDNVRRIIFSIKQVQDVIDNEVETNEAMVLTRPFARLYNGELKYIDDIVETKPFDDNWDREIKVVTQLGKPEVVRQRLVVLTPTFARVEARQLAWGCSYSTQELGPFTVLRLLYAHPDLVQKNGMTDVKRRLSIVRFVRQAGWYDVAEKELDALLKDAPGSAKEITEARDGLELLKLDRLVTDVERAQKAGRHDWVLEQLAHLPKLPNDAGAKQLATLANLKAKCDSTDESLKAVPRYLKDLVDRIANADERKSWEEAATAITAEVNADNVGRLESFLKFAEQDVRERVATKKPTNTPSELLALAVSGWLLGNGAAETKTDVAMKLWRTRQFVLEYLRTPGPAARAKLLTTYEKYGAIAFDEMAQLIRTLPPPDAEEKLSDKPLELEAKLFGRRYGRPYLVQLPPEYTHGRPYPLLMVLHNSDEKPKAILERWSEQARQNGYILIAPEWGGGLRGAYSFSAEDHGVVTDVLRDVQRRFNVDSDRIFLSGYGEGGQMAFDVGLSHPDLFAGVVPMGAAPKLFSVKYAPNSMHLPFYVVAGTFQNGDAFKSLTKQFGTWVARGYPAYWIDYRGRALEWFDAELPYALDWMNRKKRSTSTPETAEFQTHRTTDNRFYWLGVDGIAPVCQLDAGKFNYFSAPAAVQGKIGEGNSISIHARSVKQVTVWLARGMIDFDKPVSISINVRPSLNKRKLTPSLTTLLEDFYQRADRQRLYLVRVDLPLEK